MSEYGFLCPNCSQNISAPGDQAGRMIHCPTCKHQFRAPKPVVSPSPSPITLSICAAGSCPVSASMGNEKPPLIGRATAAAPPIAYPSDLERQILDGGRFVVFQYCFSVLVITFKRSSPVMFLRQNEDGASSALSYSMISLFAGWWGIPWGPIWTVATIITNLGGGKDLTPALLTQQVGADRAAQIMAQRKRPSPQRGLKALRWGFAGVAALPVLAILALTFVGAQHEARRTREPGEAQFAAANREIEMYRGAAAVGNTPKAVDVATTFSSEMKKLRAELFEGGKPSGFSVSHHEFLTCCELQETQCVFLVHVPELRRFNDSAKISLSALTWGAAQHALQKEKAGKPGMGLAIGLRGVTLYDRVLIGTYAPDADDSPRSLKETITTPHAEEALFPWFRSPASEYSSP
jgi:hypothetical protein